MTTSLRISHGFDSGSIEVVDCSDPADIRLRLRDDNAADIRQWFHFRVLGAACMPLRMVFENAASATYAGGWPDYRAVASYDRRQWFRVPTSYDNDQLVIEHTPEHDSVYYAYFEPYAYDRHLDFIGRVAFSPFAECTSLGTTVQGREIDCITIGRPAPGRVPVWVIARQHPGETMAEWFVEGLVERLIDASDPVSRRIHECAVVYVVPNMNPDGAVLGNLRTNAAGRNLNREWVAPDPEESPEVFVVRAAMQATGCDLFLDIHGDETLPYVFFSTADDVPDLPPELAAVQARFIDAVQAASPDFQTEFGYENGRFGPDTLKLASKWVAHHFQCLSLTLEMPFKDNANLPDERAGWSAERSKRLGESMLAAVLGHVSG